MIKPINNKLVLRVEYSQDWPMLLHTYTKSPIVLEADSFKDDKHTLHVLQYLKKHVSENGIDFTIKL